MNKRIIGSNAHGFNNESSIVDSLNNKKLKDLNANLRRFIKDICEDNEITVSNDMLIQARVEIDNKLKQDFYVTLDKEEFGISAKMGTGNSVHQEKIEEFIQWLDEVAEEATDEIKDCFRFFIWADGSIDGSAPIVKDKDGNIIDRFGGKAFKKLYPEKRRKLQEFLDNNSMNILNRAIFQGKNYSKVDYVYHGNPLNGVWISKKDILKFNIQNPKSKTTKNTPTLSVGKLTVQAWNVSMKGNTEKKRGEIQFKYSSMVDDFSELMTMKSNNIGTFEGDKEEFNLSKIMNKNKTHKFWNVISGNCSLEASKDNYYIVKVEGNKKSKLTGKKVKCKSDNFVIKANINREYLLQCEYQITESMLKKIENYEIVEGSGISVKRADSQKYTIAKLTQNTFKKAFKEYIDGIEFIVAGLLVYTSKDRLKINKKILEDLNIKEEDIKEFYLNKHGVKHRDTLDKEFMDEISIKAKTVVREVIENNLNLKASLFTGRGWFSNPYFINFVFKNGQFTSEVYTDYSISNGSGRSRGIYTVILKPQFKGLDRDKA